MDKKLRISNIFFNKRYFRSSLWGKFASKIGSKNTFKCSFLLLKSQYFTKPDFRRTCWHPAHPHTKRQTHTHILGTSVSRAKICSQNTNKSLVTEMLRLHSTLSILHNVILYIC